MNKKVKDCVDWKPSHQSLAAIESMLSCGGGGMITIDNGDGTESYINVHPSKTMGTPFLFGVSDEERAEVLAHQETINRIVPDTDDSLSLQEVLDQIAAAQATQAVQTAYAYFRSTRLSFGGEAPLDPSKPLLSPLEADHLVRVVLDITARCGPDYIVGADDIERYLCHDVIPGVES